MQTRVLGSTGLEVVPVCVGGIDTAANYGGGESERRIGLALAERGGLPSGFVLATKADRDPPASSRS